MSESPSNAERSFKCLFLYTCISSIVIKHAKLPLQCNVPVNSANVLQTDLIPCFATSRIGTLTAKRWLICWGKCSHLTSNIVWAQRRRLCTTGSMPLSFKWTRKVETLGVRIICFRMTIATRQTSS